jgi:single-strand DNA-binding protein
MSKGTVNKVFLIGNLGDDPEIKYTPNGTPVARVSLATTETYKRKASDELVTETEWHRLILWAGLAQVAKQYLKKGSKLHVEGRIKTRSWDDKETGQKRYAQDIVVGRHGDAWWSALSGEQGARSL